MKYLIITILAALFFVSCEKEISIDLNSKEPKLVIEGIITDEPGNYTVKISETVNFSDANNFPPVSNALVIITANIGLVDTLKEEKPGIYHTKKITGTPGVKYDLYVKVADKEYFATSIMPQKVTVENVMFTQMSDPTGKQMYMTIPVFTDPIELGNSYRFLQKTTKAADKTIIITNDNSNNGKVNKRPILSRGFEITMGDTVTVEMRCIDANIYTYFFTFSQIAGTNPGSSAVPSNPQNNITGSSALGYFSAQTVSKITKVVQ